MPFLIHGVLILVYLIAIILACSLFTNAIELLGSKLKLGNSATGGILAVIGTTLPETVVPIVAIISAIIFQKPAGIEIAQGAVIGSPFMLSTFALSLVGFCLLFLKRQELKVNSAVILRFYKYFLITYVIGILMTFVHNYQIRILVCGFLMFCYLFFIKRTIKKSKEEFLENEIEELILNKIFCIKNVNLFFIWVQIIFSLIALVFSSHYFVKEIAIISRELSFNSVLLSLIITPFATELPECINSIIWTKQNKDELALANILGAIIFQSVIPMSIGILFTPWILNKTILLNTLFVILCSIFIILTTLIQKKLSSVIMAFCFVFYIGYIIFILL